MEGGEIKANQPYLPTKLFLHADETKQTTEQNTAGCAGPSESRSSAEHPLLSWHSGTAAPLFTQTEWCRSCSAPHLHSREGWFHPQQGQPHSSWQQHWPAAGMWFGAKEAPTALGGHWAPQWGGTQCQEQQLLPKMQWLMLISEIGRFRLDIRELKLELKFLQRLPRAVVEAPSLEGFNRLVMWCSGTGFAGGFGGAGGQLDLTFSNLNNSTILSLWMQY